MTDVLRVDSARIDADSIARAAACLRDGGLVAFPTETVYGLGVSALDRDAVRRLFAAKGRPANDPLIVHVGSLDDVSRVTAGPLPIVARRLAERFWPGPLTLVLRRAPHVPDEVTAGLATVAVRVPAHPVARALLEAAGLPVAAPSANLFSRPSPTRAEHVRQDLDGRIDLILDGGATTVGLESTVLDLTSDPPTVLRPGAVTLEMLREVVPGVRSRAAASDPSTEPMASPGLMSKHYAPRAPLLLYRGAADRVRDALLDATRRARAAGQRVGVLASQEDAADAREAGGIVEELGAAGDAAAMATRLYAALRALDAQGAEVILAADITGDEGLRRALRDRLERAAARIVSTG